MKKIVSQKVTLFSLLRYTFTFVFYMAVIVMPSQAGLQYGFFTSYDDLLIRTGKVPSKVKPAKGTILLLQGLGGFIEYYYDIMESLAERGYDVLTLDWRGQGDSGRFTDKQTLLHIDNFKSYVKDLKMFISLNPNLTRPLIFLASSMGGNIALHYAHDHPRDMDAIVALAPMIKINTTPYPYAFAEGLVKFIVSIGLGDQFVFGYSAFSYETCVKNYNPMKNGDKQIYLRDCKFLKEQPQLAVGGPSFQWLYEAFKASEDFDNEAYLKQIKVPFMIISSENDYLVNVDAQTNLCKILPNCRLLMYQDAHHNILKDANNVISRLVKDVDVFFVNFNNSRQISKEPQQQYVYTQTK